jgi:DMSO/TMAO reductase YedYZ molybdopterin-dependent catalytic subunit
MRIFIRRDFLRTAGATGVGLLTSPFRLPAQDTPATPSSIIKGKDDRLVIHTKFPAVMETPLSILDGHAVTPSSVLFVRNNQQLEGSATLDPLPLAGWKIELTGLIDKKLTLDAADIAKMPTVEREMVLQCSGNARSQFSKAAKVSGTPWGKGGFGNVKFAGVPLSAILEKHGVKIDRAARFVAAEGRDPAVAPGKPDFEHSLPLDEVLKKSILALQLNGKPLPAVHGGPVRLVTPGFYGTMHLKWLSRLRFEKDETSNYFQLPQYRTPKERIKPGAPFEYTYENSNPSWRMKINSFILSPGEGNAIKAEDKLTIRGVAFNDGEAAIDRVEVSCDDGKTWTRAEMEKSADPFAWVRWSLRTSFGSGKFGIWSRATDTLRRTQPLDGLIDWNPHGYEWNGVDRVEVTAR